ncbi:10776_t:CDS:2, partial [Racocetra persica]
SDKPSFNNSPSTASSHQKSSRIVQSLLSSVLQLASSTNSTVEFTKREFVNSQMVQSNKKSLLSEMLKKQVDTKGNSIINATTTTGNETPIKKERVLKFGNCPLVVRERSSTHTNDDSSSKPNLSADEPSQTTSTVVMHKRTNLLSPLPITTTESPTSSHSTTSHYSTAVSILTPTNTTTTIHYYKSKSLPYPRNGIIMNTQPVNLSKKGIPIPLYNHYGNKDKLYRRRSCHRHSHHGDGKNHDKKLDLERTKDDDILFWPMST